jgi:hypothetical protein
VQLINVLAEELVEFGTMGSSILLHEAAVAHVAVIGNASWFHEFVQRTYRCISPDSISVADHCVS